MVKQTAGHDALGEFAPEFAHLNDDILFGEVWSREDKLSLKLRSVVTVSAAYRQGNHRQLPDIPPERSQEERRNTHRDG